MRRITSVIAAVLIVAVVASAAHALPIVVPNFSVDPSGDAFTIQAIAPGAPGSNNIAAAPVLQFGVTSSDGTPDTLQMNWEPEIAGEEAQAGWELVFGADPNLFNQTISLSINPPGGWSGNVGTSSFGGIISVEVRAIDFGGVLAGGWGFNTDMAGLLIVNSDPLASGVPSVLQNNIMHNVVINVGAGPAAGSAAITPFGGMYGSGPFTGPNYLIPGNNNFGFIQTLQFFENGILQGGLTVIPGQVTPNLLNYWDHVLITPEPSSFVLLLMGVVGLVMYRRRTR